MNALEARKHTLVSDDSFGLDADAWFSALDHRIVEVGAASCMATVLGIHSGPTGLWIQMSCADDSDVTAVLFVNEHTRLIDVLEKLSNTPPVGSPLEIIDCTPSVHAASIASPRARAVRRAWH